MERTRAHRRSRTGKVSRSLDEPQRACRRAVRRVRLPAGSAKGPRKLESDFAEPRSGAPGELAALKQLAPLLPPRGYASGPSSVRARGLQRSTRRQPTPRTLEAAHGPAGAGSAKALRFPMIPQQVPTSCPARQRRPVLLLAALLLFLVWSNSFVAIGYPSGRARRLAGSLRLDRAHRGSLPPGGSDERPVCTASVSGAAASRSRSCGSFPDPARPLRPARRARATTSLCSTASSTECRHRSPP